MNNININNVIQMEVDRITNKYQKDFLDCKDIMQITGLGRDKVHEIMNLKDFPRSEYGRRKTVSVVSFVIWQMKNNTKGGIYEAKN